jgi:hypothetical protein
MLFQNPFIERIIIVSIAQIWPIIYFSFFSFKLLKRTRNLLTTTLASIFILNAIVYISIFFSIFAVGTSFSFPFYLAGFYIFIFSHGGLIIFSALFLMLDKQVKTRNYYLAILCYLLLGSYVLWMSIFFDGIIYNSSTDWRPQFSWLFFTVSIFYIIFFLILPEIIISIKLIKMFRGTAIEKRIRMFTTSIFLEFFIVFSTTLFNTWTENAIYRMVLPFINLIIGTLAASLIYWSFGIDFSNKEN